jgi:hypothetical protein
MAVRIRARAIRRCGELLKEIPARVGGYSPTHRSERAKAAKDAGLSPDQTKTALRLAKIPDLEFEDAVESENPPTVGALADRGTQARGLGLDTPIREPEAARRDLRQCRTARTAFVYLADEDKYRGRIE